MSCDVMFRAMNGVVEDERGAARHRLDVDRTVRQGDGVTLDVSGTGSELGIGHPSRKRCGSTKSRGSAIGTSR